MIYYTQMDPGYDIECGDQHQQYLYSQHDNCPRTLEGDVGAFVMGKLISKWYLAKDDFTSFLAKISICYFVFGIVRYFSWNLNTQTSFAPRQGKYMAG
jgi:hypothetical protein